MEEKKPFFYDITLRDGNQALKKPWNTRQKEVIFNQLVKLGRSRHRGRIFRLKRYGF